MRKSAIIATRIGLIAFVALSIAAPAFSGGPGNSPSGRPFVQIQGEIVQLQGKVSSLQEQIDAIVGTVNSMEERVGADRNAIASLQAQSATLQAQIDGNATDLVSLNALIASLQSQTAALQAQIAANSGDIAAAETQIAVNNGLIASLQQTVAGLTTLESQVARNSDMIALLQTEIAHIENAIAQKQDIMNGVCPEGAFVQSVSNGTLVCEYPPAAGSTISRVKVSQIGSPWYPNDLVAQANCPAGYTVAGGGFNTVGMTVENSRPNQNGWYASGKKLTGYNYLAVEANCIDIQ